MRRFSPPGRAFPDERADTRVGPARFGPPDEETGSGLKIYIYNLEDGRRLGWGFSGGRPLVYARLEEPGGSMTDLELK